MKTPNGAMRPESLPPIACPFAGSTQYIQEGEIDNAMSTLDLELAALEIGIQELKDRLQDLQRLHYHGMSVREGLAVVCMHFCWVEALCDRDKMILEQSM